MKEKCLKQVKMFLKWLANCIATTIVIGVLLNMAAHEGLLKQPEVKIIIKKECKDNESELKPTVGSY
jgi:hypothetical protein